MVGCRIELIVGAGGSALNPTGIRAADGGFSWMTVDNANGRPVTISASGGKGGKHAKKNEDGYTLGSGGGGGN